MRLTVLGSGTLQPTKKRGCSGYLIQISDKNIMFDAGSGTLRQLARIDVTAEDVDYIFISHLHLDHTADIAPILFAKRHVQTEHKKDVAIFGPPGFRDFYSRLESLYTESIKPAQYSVTVEEYSNKVLKFPEFSITFIPMKHTENSFGFRIMDKRWKIISYTGDTDYCENLVTLCRNSDLALVECTFPDGNKVEGHLTPGEAGKAAQEAACRRLLLTHVFPPTEKEDILTACARYFKGDVSVAEELKTITIN